MNYNISVFSRLVDKYGNFELLINFHFRIFPTRKKRVLEDASSDTDRDDDDDDRPLAVPSPLWRSSKKAKKPGTIRNRRLIF